MYNLTDTDKGLFKTEIKPDQFLDLQVIKKDNESTISSLEIAKHLKVEHRATIQLIGKYLDKLELFGRVTFEMTPTETPGGVQMSKVYFLNENQAIFLSTLSKNTENVVKFKALLTKAFSNLKENQKQPKELTRLEILELAIESEKENQRLKQIVIERAESVPAETMRITINRVVREYAKSKGLIFSNVWNKLYQEFKYLYHIDLKTRAKKGQSKIQIAEDLGRLEDLYNLSLKMFEVDKNLILK
jgi:phage regulator Rha-like protein